METKELDLKKTVNLPKTGFGMKANLPQTEPKTLAHWKETNLYEQIRKTSAGRPRYVLHDGPPYANGRIHLGTAFNKILKDFIVKSKTMSGFDSPYVPGWDCHGLPIEIKVDGELGKKKASMTQGEIRRECRKYAEKFVELQSEDFQRLGVFGQWDDPYLTMNASYQAHIANHSDPDLSVHVGRASGSKCERCWKYSTAIGFDPAYAKVCDTCAAALKEILE